MLKGWYVGFLPLLLTSWQYVNLFLLYDVLARSLHKYKALCGYVLRFDCGCKQIIVINKINNK